MTDDALRLTLAANLARVEEGVAAACDAAGRPRDSVTLVAVTKYVGLEVAAALHELGARDLGESRPQELWRKAAALPATARWHQIGRLQRNKADRTAGLLTMLHSLSGFKLLDHLEALPESALPAGRRLPALLEFNVSREPNKDGFTPDDVPALADRLASLRRVEVRGLMTMAALGSDADGSRRTFAECRQLRDELRRRAGAGVELPELSMGMSGDYPGAILESATVVRIGSALFEGVLS